jgi:hypothetical protein
MQQYLMVTESISKNANAITTWEWQLTMPSSLQLLVSVEPWDLNALSSLETHSEVQMQRMEER